MKKRILIILVIVVMLFVMAAPVFAGPYDWHFFCKIQNSQPFAECMKSVGQGCWGGVPSVFKNHGECVRYFMAGKYN